MSIAVENVSKKFSLRVDRANSVGALVKDWVGRKPKRQGDFWALKDVSLEVMPGETLGIIGSNGSGKSTLLKLLTGTMLPTSGKVTVHGTIAAMIELGAGFHPDFSGRENVFLSGAIMGLTREQIAARFNEIVAFAEMENFIDTPIKYYSSGMYARLGFSLSVAVDPDVLLVDEVLAVGDEAFQKKCMDRIRQMQAGGKTIVLVTHDLGAVERICTRAVWLDKGVVRASGATRTVIDEYRRAVWEEQQARKPSLGPVDVQLVEEAAAAEADPASESIAPEPASDSSRWGNRDLEITAVTVLNPAGQPVPQVRSGDTVTVRMSYTVHRPVPDVVFGIGLVRSDGVHIYGTNSFLDRVDLGIPEGSGEVDIVLPNLALMEGLYYLDAAVHSTADVHYDFRRRAVSFSVTSLSKGVGIFQPEHYWRHGGLKLQPWYVRADKGEKPVE